MIRKLLAATAIVAIMAGAADAKKAIPPKDKDDFTYLYKGDDWYAYYTKVVPENIPACGMTMSAENDRGQYMFFNMKTIKGDGGHSLLFMIVKNSWKFPGNDLDHGVDVPLSIGFNTDYEHEYVTAVGGGYMQPGPEHRIPTVQFFVDEMKEGELDAFLELIAHADKMWVKFKSGNENPWRLSMRGSRGSVTAFRECLAKLDEPRETQPYMTGPKSQPKEHDNSI